MQKKDLLEEMSSLGLGLKRNHLKFVSVQSSWIALAQKVSVFLSHMTQNPVQIIGSSCVSGLLAKPILDFLLLYKGNKLDTSVIGLLEDFGFTHKGDVVSKLHNAKEDPSRNFFACYDAQKENDFIHIHALVHGSPVALEKIKFRDKLLKNYKSVERYNAFKLRCLKEKLSREKYRLSKEKIIAKILEDGL